jgi:hypothetical protein
METTTSGYGGGGRKELDNIANSVSMKLHSCQKYKWVKVINIDEPSDPLLNSGKALHKQVARYRMATLYEPFSGTL